MSAGGVRDGGASGRDPGTSGVARLGAGKEFDRIRRILAGGEHGAVRELLVGPGDDAVVLADGTVLSTDLSVEGIHFRLDWISPEEAGFRAAAGALSDLAGMGAEVVGVLASVAAPGDGALAEPLMAGVRRCVEGGGGILLGGDLTRSPGPLLVDVVVVGRTRSPLTRSGARPGDRLWVTGVLGGAAGAVALQEVGKVPPEPLRRRFAAPVPRLAEGRWLREAGASAGLDLSDGIAGDAGHLAAASGVRAVLEAAAIPVDPAAAAGLPETHPPISLALHGGEDYELLVAAPEGILERRVEEFVRRFDLSLTRVGWVEEGDGVFLVLEGSDVPAPILRGGFDHFFPSRDDDSS